MNLVIRFLIPSFVLLFFGCDSNKLKLKQANNDSVSKYLRWADNRSFPILQRYNYNQKAFSFIDLDKNDTVMRWYLSKIAYNFSNMKKGELYNKISKIHLEKSIQAKDTLNIARYYRFRGGYYRWNQIYDSAFFYYSKAEKLYKKTNDHFGLAKTYYYKGLLQYEFDDYLAAELSINQALILVRERKYDFFTNRIFNTLGNIAHNLKQYDNAIRIHKKNLNLVLNSNLPHLIEDENLISISLNNIGNAYKEDKQYEEAILYFRKGLQEPDIKLKDPTTYAYMLSNMGYCKMQLKEYEGVPDLFINAINTFEGLKNKQNESAITHIYLSDFYFRNKDTLNAIVYAEKAKQLAKKTKAPYYYLIALSHAGFVNKGKASQYIEDYHRISDSLQFEQRKARSQFYKILLETDEIVRQKEKVVKQKWLMGSVISGVLFIVILLFVIFRQRAKQKELALRQRQQKTNEDIYQMMLNERSKIEEARQLEKNRIALELQDGIMNKLTSTRMNLFVLTRKNDAQTIADCLGYIADIQTIENEIRSLSHNLSSEIFTDKGNSANY